MLYNVPLYKVRGGQRGRPGKRMRRGGPAPSWREQKPSAEARLSAPEAALPSDAQQPGGTERLSSIASELQPEPPITKPGDSRPLPCSHLASRNRHLGAAHRAGLISPHSQLTIAGGTWGGEAFRPSEPWQQGYLLPSCNVSPQL